jgi:pyridoxine 5-phosphate synthase
MPASGLKLGVNIDHVATLRQARGVAYPSPVEAARICEQAGAHGITVHLREDRRHIQDADVAALRASIRTRLNLEMANVPEIVRIACAVRPDEVCLVPEKRQELTTEGGLDVAGQRGSLDGPIATLAQAGILVSLFIDPDPAQVRAAAELGAPCIELHTGAYCAGGDTAGELDRLIAAARLGHALGLQINAGHGLNVDTVGGILDVPWLDTLNIGHSIVARALFIGLDAAVNEMLGRLAAYRGGRRDA